jgi:hypothetical protein
MTSTKIELRDRLTMIAAQARLISLAATGLNENGTLGDGDLTGVVELADRIEQQLIGSPTRLTLASQMNWAARRVRANPSGCSRCSR